MKFIKKLFVLSCIFALSTVSLTGCFGVEDVKTLRVCSSSTINILFSRSWSGNGCPKDKYWKTLQ
jgi:hypothetical protein